MRLGEHSERRSPIRADAIAVLEAPVRRLAAVMKRCRAILAATPVVGDDDTALALAARLAHHRTRDSLLGRQLRPTLREQCMASLLLCLRARAPVGANGEELADEEDQDEPDKIPAVRGAPRRQEEPRHEERNAQAEGQRGSRITVCADHVGGRHDRLSYAERRDFSPLSGRTERPNTRRRWRWRAHPRPAERLHREPRRGCDGLVNWAYILCARQHVSCKAGAATFSASAGDPGREAAAPPLGAWSFRERHEEGARRPAHPIARESFFCATRYSRRVGKLFCIHVNARASPASKRARARRYLHVPFDVRWISGHDRLARREAVLDGAKREIRRGARQRASSARDAYERDLEAAAREPPGGTPASAVVVVSSAQIEPHVSRYTCLACDSKMDVAQHRATTEDERVSQRSGGWLARGRRGDGGRTTYSSKHKWKVTTRFRLAGVSPTPVGDTGRGAAS